jgi:hypothetical protein
MPRLICDSLQITWDIILRIYCNTTEMGNDQRLS